MAKITETLDAAANLSTSFSVSAGDVFQGSMTPGDRDWIRTELVAGKTYTFASTGVRTSASDPVIATELVLRDSNGNQLASNANGGPGNFSNLTFTAQVTGTYFIETKGLIGTNTGAYLLSLSEGTKANYTMEMGAAAILREGRFWNSDPNTEITVTWGASRSYSDMRDAADDPTVFSQLTSEQVSAFRLVLSMYSDVSGLNFRQIRPTGTTNNATILISNYTSYTDGSAGYTFLPGDNDVRSVDGDIQLNKAYVSTTNLAFGTYSYFIMLHEFGHAVGLQHPGDYNSSPGVSITYDNSAQFVQDSQQYTVMSYFSGAHTGAVLSQYPQTLMMYDIYALQQVYGVRMTTRTGDTVYGFNSNAGDVYNFALNTMPVVCIWDSGGIDTLDASGFTQNQTINLNQGAFSDIGSQKGNVSIAYNAVIENANGGSGDDLITGNDANNVLNGNGGNDTLRGNAGNDLLRGGDGKNYLDGGAGTDTADYSNKTVAVAATLNGASTSVVKVGGVATDTLVNIENLIGGSGNDRLKGDANDNVLKGGLGKDVLDGAGGQDTADYSDKSTSIEVTLKGAAKSYVKVDTIVEDTISNIENVVGGSGNDTLTGDDDDNVLVGASGNDTLSGGSGTNVLDGGEGTDTADFSDSRTSVRTELNGATAAQVSVGNLGLNTIINVENVIGGFGKDTLIGDRFDNVFRGGGDQDFIDGGYGTDTADYSDKSTSVQITLNGATKAVALIGGVIEDTIVNIENVTGGFGSDILTGDAKDNTLLGNMGKDLLKGGDGGDILDGGSNFDTADYSDKTLAVHVALRGGNASTVYVGGVAEDTILYIENVIGGSGNDVLTGDDQHNTFLGGAGDDIINGAGGTDTVDYSDKTEAVNVSLKGAVFSTVTVGGIVEDRIVSIESVIGGSGADVIIGDHRDNVLTGGFGSDFLNGGAGIDTADYSEKTVGIEVTLNGSQNTIVKVGGVDEDTIVNIENILGGSGADVITGDARNNRLDGGLGNDILNGGDGNDVFIGQGGVDMIDGGAGKDLVDYSTMTASIELTLNGSTATVSKIGGIAEDIVVNVEDIMGGHRNDTLRGDLNDNSINGFVGDDLISGGGGNDFLDGGSGNDTVDYSDKTDAVDVILKGILKTKVYVAGVLEDTIVNFENLIGGTGNDSLTGDSNQNALTGGLGGDFLDGGEGSDTAIYREKTLAVQVALKGASNTTVYVGGIAEDTIVNIENLTGGSGNDTLEGDAQDNTFQGNAGNDVIDGGDGSDTSDYSEKTGSIQVTLKGGQLATVLVGGVAEDRIVNIENIKGTIHADTLTGDENDNTFFGDPGNDIFMGGLGHDVLNGGEGWDTADYSDKLTSIQVALNGRVNATVYVDGTAEDTIVSIENVTGGSGDDMLFGDRNDNALIGGSGNDWLKGAEGNDFLTGGLGQDDLNGGIGIDTASYSDKTGTIQVTLNGSRKAVVLVGGVAEDTITQIENLIGGSSSDWLNGDTADNNLNGGLGDDTLKGGAGNDVLTGGGGFDVIDGGSGVDTVSFQEKRQTIQVALNGATTATVFIDGIAEDTIVNIENIWGGTGSDILRGDDADNLISGYQGHDILMGGGGKDFLDGGSGFDTADYSDKSQSVWATLIWAERSTVYVGGQAEDTILGIDNLIGGSGDDILVGGVTINSLIGGAGNDTLIGGLGRDVLDGGTGSDTADYSEVATSLTVTLLGAQYAKVRGDLYGEDEIKNIENIKGGTAADFIIGDTENNRLEGNSGDDTLSGDAGNDTLVGGLGLDILTGGAGADTFVFSFASGTDTVSDFNQTDDTFAFVRSTFGILADALIHDYFILSETLTDLAIQNSPEHGFFLANQTGIYWDDDGSGSREAVKLVGYNPVFNLDFDNFLFV